MRAGEVVPVDGAILDATATLDEAALTGEPIPVTRATGEPVRSGAINAGATFEMRALATAGASTYAGIVRMVTAAQTAKAPFIRIADRFALILLPVTLVLAAAAWLLSGDPIRGLAVLVASTPCPLILAAPVAFIAGVSRAARAGILIKGGGALEALALTHTVMFDKTGTLTIGGAQLVAIETAPGERCAPTKCCGSPPASSRRRIMSSRRRHRRGLQLSRAGLEAAVQRRKPFARRWAPVSKSGAWSGDAWSMGPRARASSRCGAGRLDGRAEAVRGGGPCGGRRGARRLRLRGGRRAGRGRNPDGGRASA